MFDTPDEIPHTEGFFHGKCILIVSAEPWNGLQMSKHHLAEALAARGNRILWLDAPKNGLGPITLSTDGVVERVGYRHWLRGVNRLPVFVQRWYSRHLLRSIETCAGQRVDIIWRFDPSRLGHLPREGRRSIFHPVDYKVLEAESSAAREADLVLTSSKDILDRVQEIAPAALALNIGHALDPRWLDVLETMTVHSRNPRPVVTYAGNLAIQYMDWEVLHAEVIANHQADFRFVGPGAPQLTDPWFLKFREQPNVQFIGPLPKEKMIPELRQADVLVLCYRSDLWPQQLSNPHKVLEYLSTGNVIVASATSEYEGTSPMVMPMANKRWEHPVLLAEVLNDLGRYNAPELRAARIAIARSRTTTIQVENIERILQAGRP
jgi:glycosyltransferase involved in cell wall biosynthesis